MDCSPPKRWKADNDVTVKDHSDTFFEAARPHGHLTRSTARGMVSTAASEATPPRPSRSRATMNASSDDILSRRHRTACDVSTQRQDSGVCTALHHPRQNDRLSDCSSSCSLDLREELEEANGSDGYKYIANSALHSVLQFNAAQVLLLDCRTALAYDRTRIGAAISVQFSALMLRRLKRQANVKVRLDHLQLSDTTAIAARKRPDTLVVVYDEESTVIDPLSPAGVLWRILVDEGVQPVFLKGGMAEHRRLYPSDMGEVRPAVVPARKPLHPVLKAVSRARPRNDLPATRVTSHLVLGNQSQGGNVAFLTANKITHVINVTETPFAKPVINTVKCMQIPLIDSGCHDLLSVVPDALRFIETARQGHGRTLIYCSTGCSRAAALVLAYMMATRKFTYVTAVAELQRQRPDARPHGSFMQQLLDFQTILNKTPVKPRRGDSTV
eukprot:m.81331 g.81331  ORF g.81331 m.81331 type:complete len:442 (-) comp14569_c0_seq1:266-1591(-)